MADTKSLTKNEIDKFLKNNQHGILSMAGDKPYALPMGYMYKRRTILMGLVTTGRKMKYIKKSNNICFTICMPRWLTPKLKTPCTTAVVEGSLEKVTNRSCYGLKTKVPAKLQLYKIKVSKMGARKCNRKPCELFAEKN
ncbi:MAG: pyridoxamine 5'-phosphate oxidase family protein [Deltaproteobacteria bacterium]|nr:pyridoxamine 5'-phosphate oxidase family protein [Deltaproteobacteria bacterium]